MQRWIAVVVAGVAWGAFCALGNFWPATTTFVQMAVPWMWVAALVGFRQHGELHRAALAGAVALMAANVAYFAVGAIAILVATNQVVGGVRFLLVWSAVGLVVGPASAVLGRLLAGDPASLVAAAALATAAVAEPLALWAHVDHLDAHITYVVVALVGVIAPQAITQGSVRRRLISTAWVVIAAYPTAVVLEAVLIALGQVSAPMRLV